jgi:hypothetical protein
MPPSSDAPGGPTSSAIDPSFTSDAISYHDMHMVQQNAMPTATNKEVMGPPELPRNQDEPIRFEQITEVALSRALQQSPARVTPADQNSLFEDAGKLTPNGTRRLLFPSPRKDGEFKTLDNSAVSTPVETPNDTTIEKPAEPTINNTTSEKSPEDLLEEADKENCPPSFDQDTGLADLFNFSNTPFTSPMTSRILAKNLRTPTSSSRRARNALGERSGGDGNQADSLTLPATPSRAPRASPGAMTPFYKDLLDRVGGSSSSPGQGLQIDLQSFFDPPSDANNHQASFTFDKNIFGSPGFFNNFLSSETMLPSDMPMPSSPPIVGHSHISLTNVDNLIEFYEDATATSGPGTSQDMGTLADTPISEKKKD